MRPILGCSGTVGFGGSLIITESVPPGGAVTVVVVAKDCDQYSVVVTVGFGGSLIITESVPPEEQ